MTTATLTKSQILGLSPDPFVIKNALKELEPSKWANLGRKGSLVWGEFLRSNNLPYTVKIDLERLAVQCTCVSVKNPCRFSVALMLLVHQSPELFTESEPPEWATKWYNTLTRRGASGEAEVDEQKLDRIVLIQRGMAEFGVWLKDVVNEGLAKLPERSKEVINPMVDRLYDAQAIQVATDLKKMGQLYFPKKAKPPADWPAKVLSQLGRFYLLSQAWGAYNKLTELQQADLCIASGFFSHLDFSQNTVYDEWLVLGRRSETTGRQTVRRMWLQGRSSGRYALLSENVTGKQATVHNRATNLIYAGEIGFAPSTHPILGRFKAAEINDRPSLKNLSWEVDHIGEKSIAIPEAQRQYADQLTRNPWLAQMPLMLQDVYLRRHSDSWWVVDRNGRSLPLKSGMRQDWYLFSYSQGRPMTLFGEISLNRFEPVSVWDVERGWSDLIVWGRLR